MKKGCLIVLVILAVLLAVLVIGGFVAYNMVNERVGLSPSRVISHEELVVGDTRVRAVFNPLLLAPFAADYISPEMNLPVNAEQVKQLMPYVLPREIALLARTDVLGHKLNLTLFANEQRGGKFLKEQINLSQALSQIKQITWTAEGIQLPERGNLFAEGAMDIPETVEQELLELWPTGAKEEAARIDGGNQLELVVDNRNGDILAMAAAFTQAAGQNWELVRGSQYGATVIGIVESIYVARLKANLTDKDTAVINLRIDSDAEKGPGLQMLMAGLALPALRETLKKNYNLDLEGELPWDADQNAVIGELRLTGLEAFIRSKIIQGSGPVPSPV